VHEENKQKAKHPEGHSHRDVRNCLIRIYLQLLEGADLLSVHPRRQVTFGGRRLVVGVVIHVFFKNQIKLNDGPNQNTANLIP